ncbi:MAG TPA: CT583 family protein [Chlamydiales bacterium]|nr:CT583 family protein [Chlamydiales bacterium]
MSKFNDLLNLRFRQKDSTKMTALVEKSNSGNLSSFSGIFRVTSLNPEETSVLEAILKNFRADESFDISADLRSLGTITSEVKAITNQAVILHGERIKKAQEILKNYLDGAFTAWLYATYGNRQTPYNFLQYYEFYAQMPQALHAKIDQMPRQVIYTLASRNGDTTKKEEIVKNYSGQTKQELLALIRTEFPLNEFDKRLPNLAAQSITFMKKARELLKKPLCVPSEAEKMILQKLIAQLHFLIQKH